MAVDIGGQNKRGETVGADRAGLNELVTSPCQAASVQNIPKPWPAPLHDPAAVQRALAEQVQHTVAIARALAGSGRPVDLAGLDQAMGLLCAKALDLPPDQGRLARPALAVVLAELDLLSTTLRAKAPV